MSLTTEAAILREMIRIRMVETEIARRYQEQEMRCPTHLSIGQEAVPAAFSQCVRTADFAVSTHRGHAHYLGKGGALRPLIAELYGKEAGCSKGRGGSMHLIDLGVNFYGTSAIVGNSIPVGVGLALSAQLRGSDQVSCVFLGDGAVEEGVFYESVNFAAVRSLPVLFVCENNAYSVYSPLSVRQPPGRSITDMVRGIGVDAACADGNDAIACYRAISEAFATVRTEGRPVFVEFMTYRWREHCGPNVDDDLGYRPAEEVAGWLARDPIRIVTETLTARDPGTSDEVAAWEHQIADEVASAFEFAIKAPFPRSETACEGVYA